MRRQWFAGLCVCVALMGSTASSAEAVIGGTPDAGRHPYVGFLYGPEFFCSGTLIAPTVFVTAAHCGIEGDRVGITTAGQFLDTAPLTPGTFHRLPGACEACGNGIPGFMAHDLAIVKLDAPITVSRYGVLPSVGASVPLRKKSVDAVGYGVNGYDRGGGKPAEIATFTRTLATLTLSGANDTISDSFLKISAQNPKGALCFGDSGGPVLAGDTVLGVFSFLNGMCTASAYAFRVDTAESLAFIAGFR